MRLNSKMPKKNEIFDEHVLESMVLNIIRKLMHCKIKLRMGCPHKKKPQTHIYPHKHLKPSIVSSFKKSLRNEMKLGGVFGIAKTGAAPCSGMGAGPRGQGRLGALRILEPQERLAAPGGPLLGHRTVGALAQWEWSPVSLFHMLFH